jgi:enoyl-CoA hydratase/carnithine racemase
MQVTFDAGANVATVAGVAGAALGELRAWFEEQAYGDARAVVLDLTSHAAGGAPPLEDVAWLRDVPVPVVAALAGDRPDFASLLALFADIRVCDRDTRVQLPGFGGRRQLALLGAEGSLEALRLGLRLDADTMLRLGLVSEVAAPGQALPAAQRIARVIASRGPIATRLGKEAIWRGRELPLEAALRYETDLTLLLQTTKDRAEGVAAFMEKRTPMFTGE